MNNAPNLLTFLVDETYKDAEGVADSRPVYFFDSRRECIVLTYGNKSLEIPTLWSQVDKSMNYSQSSLDLEKLTKNDQDFSFIVKSYFGNDIDLTSVINQSFEHIEAA